jgi:LPXTG-site transpeptidase (sortase) family protein
VVTTRSVVAVLVVGAAAFVAAAFATGNSRTGSSARDAPLPRTVAPATTRPAPPPAQTVPTAPTTQPAPSSRSTSSRPRSGPFSLVVTMRSGSISTKVGAISVASNEPVDPPHATDAQWNTAVWVKQSTYPSVPADGTTYVYGHACHYHVCPFTRLGDARVGDLARVTTASGTTTYAIERIGLSPKSATALPAWASDSTVPNRLVLVTCAYEQGDTSTSNIVVVARLIRR